MSPKTIPNSAKQAVILKYFHASGVAHSLKDLEKALPSVASINGILVKDFLQALVDDDKIHVEKIGTGNWYWAFQGEERKNKEVALARARDERDVVQVALEELQVQVDDAGVAREDEDDEEGGMDRNSLTQRHAALVEAMEPLKKELASYSENDPVELQSRVKETMRLREETEQLTDQIQSMEQWVKDTMMLDRETLIIMKRGWYEDHFDEEEQGLKELQ